MEILVVLLCLGVLIDAKPSHHHPYNDVYPIHPGVGAIYKGPNSETIIKGPDGSVITSEADGGAVALGGETVAVPIVPVVNNVAPPAVVTSHHAVSSATYEAKTISHAPIIVEEPVILKEVAPHTVLVPGTRDIATLEGPSGSIVRHGEDTVVSGPSSTTIRDGKFVVSIPNVELKTTVVEPLPNGPQHSTLFIDNSHHAVDVQVAPQIVVSSPAPTLYADAPVNHGIIQNDVGIVQNEVLVVSSTPSSILHQSPVTFGHGPIDVVSPAVSLSPPLVHSDASYHAVTPQVVAHANEAAVSAALANNARNEQSYLSAAQYAEYENAVRAENERNVLEAHLASTGYHAGHGLAQHQQLHPVISQGNQVISGQYGSSTPSPILVTSVSPVSSSVHSANSINELVAVGPQVFQTNGIVSSTVRPEVIVSSTPSFVSSTLHQDSGYLARVAPTENVVVASSPEILNNGPIISHPKAILAPVRADVSPGQVLVQSNSVSERHESSHSSSSVQHSSSTGVISGPVAVDGPILVDGPQTLGGHGVPYGPHPGFGGISSSDLAQWQHSLTEHGQHRPGRIRPVHRGAYYH